jgi:hypothetical protein
MKNKIIIENVKDIHKFKLFGLDKSSNEKYIYDSYSTIMRSEFIINKWLN